MIIWLSSEAHIYSVKGKFDSSTMRDSTFQHWVIERISPIVVEIGRIAGCVGIIVPVRQRSR